MNPCEDCNLKDRVERLEKVLLVGNGHPSILARVEAIDARLNVITRLLWLVAGQGVATIIGLLMKRFS